MNIEYISNTGFIVNTIKIEWNLERDIVREVLGNMHRDDDRTIGVASFFDGDESENVYQKEMFMSI